MKKPSDTFRKIIVITGGSSGIGKQLAMDLLKRGDTVVIISHVPDELSKVESELRLISSRIYKFCCNVKDGNQIIDAFAGIERSVGPIDVLVNNAGYAVYRTFEESSLEEILDIIDVNFMGVIKCIKAVIPYMKLRKSGQIINISSIAGRLVITPNGTYGAAKHGVVGLSEALRYELAPFGISVGVVCPGRVLTPFFDHDTFKNRTQRSETKMTIAITTVSKGIIQAIDRRTSVSYTPRRLGFIVWIYYAIPWLIHPLYAMLMRGRIRSYMTKMPKDNSVKVI